MKLVIGSLDIPVSDVVSIGPADPRERPAFGVYFSDRPAPPPPVDPSKTTVVYSASSGPEPSTHTNWSPEFSLGTPRMMPWCASTA